VVFFRGGRRKGVSIPNCTRHITRLHSCKYPGNGSKKSCRNQILFNNVDQTARVLHFLPRMWGFCPFLDYQTAREQPQYVGIIFCSLEPIMFVTIIKHLLHFCTHCDFDDSCFILHKSRYTVKRSSFSVGKAIEVLVPNCTGHITARQQLQINLVKSQSFLILCTKPPRVL